MKADALTWEGGSGHRNCPEGASGHCVVRGAMETWDVAGRVWESLREGCPELR